MSRRNRQLIAVLLHDPRSDALGRNGQSVERELLRLLAAGTDADGYCRWRRGIPALADLLAAPRALGRRPSDSAVKRARRRLRDRGLIEYEPGTGADRTSYRVALSWDELLCAPAVMDSAARLRARAAAAAAAVPAPAPEGTDETAPAAAPARPVLRLVPPPAASSCAKHPSGGGISPRTGAVVACRACGTDRRGRARREAAEREARRAYCAEHQTEHYGVCPLCRSELVAGGTVPSSAAAAAAPASPTEAYRRARGAIPHADDEPEPASESERIRARALAKARGGSDWKRARVAALLAGGAS